MKYQGIYKIRNLLNGKVYIGQSTNIKHRFYQHKKIFLDIVKYKEHYFYRAIRKYGLENFEFNVIEHIGDINKLNEKEQFWMDYYKSYNSEFGYNLRPKADSMIGYKHTEETKNKIKISIKGRQHTEETKHELSEIAKKQWKNPEHREKISNANKGQIPWITGKKHTEETKEKISLAQKGKKRKPHTEETRKKMSESHKGKVLSDEHKKVIVISQE